MSLHPEPIIVVGMQRSGTSALSGALRELGLDFGKDELLYPGDSNNLPGFFEHRRATIFNLRCLETFQMHPTSFTRLPDYWKNHPEAASLKELLKDFLKEEFNRNARWGIKQPLTSLVLPIYNEVFRELGLSPHYVLCVRNPLEVMQSESRLDFGGSYRVMAPLGKKAIGSWLRYTLGSIADSVGHKLTVVGYDRLLAEPRQEIESVLAKHTDWNPSESEWSHAVGTIRTDLRHNKAPLQALDALPSVVGKTYQICLDFDSGKSESWSLAQDCLAEFEGWRNLLSDEDAPTGKLGLAWMHDGQPHKAEVPFIPTGNWQKIRIKVDSPPKTLVSGLIYGYPCRVWIRRSVWIRGEMETTASLGCGLGSEMTVLRGVTKLDAVFEPNQIQVVTPGGSGPFELELDFLLETGPQISEQVAARVARQLDQCVEVVEILARRRGMSGL